MGKIVPWSLSYASEMLNRHQKMSKIDDVFEILSSYGETVHKQSIRICYKNERDRLSSHQPAYTYKDTEKETEIDRQID